MRAILTMPFVDRQRVVIGGQSRGGVLSVAYAGQHPELIQGVINFVGGWLGAGCSSASTVNQELFKRGVGYRGITLWLYGDADPYYPLSHSRENFKAFQAAGGIGEFRALTLPPGVSGHSVWRYPGLWGPIVQAYLRGQGLLGVGTLSRRAATGQLGMTVSTVSRTLSRKGCLNSEAETCTTPGPTEAH